jgi:hypothetical protein
VTFGPRLEPLSVAGCAWEKALSDARRCTGVGNAPGNQNALKHGPYTKGAIRERREVRALLRQSRKLLHDIE